MKVIIANINGSRELSRTDSALLEISLKGKGVSDIIYCNSLDALSNALQNQEHEKVILFTNFPTNSSYPGSGKSIQTREKNGLTERFWESDSYSKSEQFFGELNSKEKPDIIHFLTGAPKSNVPDEYLRELLGDKKITIKRRSDWKNAVYDRYMEMYRNYILRKVQAEA